MCTWVRSFNLGKSAVKVDRGERIFTEDPMNTVVADPQVGDLLHLSSSSLLDNTMSDSKSSSATQSAWKIIPHWPSKSILSTIRFYSDVLHFTTSEPRSPEPTFCSVCIGANCAANIYFFLVSDGNEELSKGKAMIAMSKEGLEEYYGLLKRERKATFVEDIEDKEWGYRQFEIVDEDGNRLQFFRFLES